MVTPKDMGEVSPQLREMFKRYQEESQKVTFQLGELEIRKARLIGSLDALARELQILIDAEATRLGIPAGKQWHVDAEGHAIMLDEEGAP